MAFDPNNKSHVPQVHRSGKMGRVPISYGEGAGAARAQEHEQHKGMNIARSGAAKHSSVSAIPPTHGGMTFNQQVKAGRGGMSHPFAGAPDASSANPMDPTVPGKKLPATKIHPSMSKGAGADQLHRDLGILMLASCKTNGGV